MSYSWGYGPDNGPETWERVFPAAAGTRQSPVDISPVDLKFLNVKKLTWKYIPENVRTLTNNGHSWVVNVDGKGSELSGGPLEGRYMLEQFHCHWGETDDVGSEHTVEGQTFAGELHLVHWNTKYSSFQEAAKHPDGLCVLGVFLKPGKGNNEIAKIVAKINCVSYKGQMTKISTPLEPSNLIPDDSHYWTYQGSLTTPPCSECVTWILFKQPIEVSGEQLKAFRTLKNYTCEDDKPCHEEGYMIKNFRPPRPLGNRVIAECKP